MSASSNEEERALPPEVRLLKWLVIILTATLIGGVITVVGLLVTRLPRLAAPMDLPETLTLPPGVEPRAVTFGQDWIAIVGSDDRIRIFGPDGTPRQEIEILPPAP